MPRTWLSPRMWAVGNLLITLYGVLFKGWSLQPLVFVFWMEVVLNIVFALVRVATALDGGKWLDRLGQRLFFLLGGGVLGVGFIMLSVTFTIQAFDGGLHAESFGGIRTQVWLLALNHAAALILHYFLNRRYATASLAGELMSSFVYLLMLLCLIMALTMHLLPRFPELNQAMWTGIAVLAVKFLVDWVRAGVSGRSVPVRL